MVYTLEDALGAPPSVFLEFLSVPRKFWRLAFERRKVQDQIIHNQLVSGTSLKKQLSWLSLACMGAGAIIATGVFSYMPKAYSSIDGPAVILSILLASIAACASALVYAEFAVEFPVVGGGFVYVLNTFGEYPAVLCAANLVIDYAFGPAAVVRNFSVFVSQVIEDIHPTLKNGVEVLNKNHFRFNGGDGTEGIDVLALSIVVVLSLVIMWSTRVYDRGNIVLQAAHMLLVLVIIVAAFTHFDGNNWSPFLPDKCTSSDFNNDNFQETCSSYGSHGALPLQQECLEGQWGANGVRRIITGASNTFFMFIGYDLIALGAEEAKTDLSVPIGMFASLSFCTIAYLLLTAGFISMYPFYGIACVEKTRTFWYAFEQVNMKWGGYIVAFASCTGIFTCTGLNIYALSRVFTVFAREGMIPAFVGQVNKVTYTPILAIATAGIVAGFMALFTSFEKLGKTTSVGTLTMYWFVAISHIYRRYAPEFETEEKHGNRHLSVPFRPKFLNFLSVNARKGIILFYLFLLTASALGFAVSWNVNEEGSQWWLLVTFSMWFCTTLTLQLTLPLSYVPEKFGVPWFFMPWIPSFSIWMNVMLVGGFGTDQQSYYNLFGAMGIATIVYLLFGVHASFWRFYGKRKVDEMMPEEVENMTPKVVDDEFSRA